jgi:hypothetical protein
VVTGGRARPTKLDDRRSDEVTRHEIERIQAPAS